MHTAETRPLAPARHTPWGVPTAALDAALAAPARCPRCRRPDEPRDMLADVRAFDGALRAAWRIPVYADVVCHGCYLQLTRYARDPGAMHDVHRALGCPPRWLDFIRRKAEWRGHRRPTDSFAGAFAAHPLPATLLIGWRTLDEELAGLSVVAIATRHGVMLRA